MTAPTAAAAEAATTPSSWIASDDTFGARLALIRQKMGWNVAKAARECGLDGESWRLWEQAGREPSRYVTICMAIANRTGCDLDWLVYGPSRANLQLRAENSHRNSAPAVPAPRRPIDPVAPRIVRPAGEVTFGDGRKTRRSGSVRTSRNPTTRRHGARPVSRAASAS